MSFRSRNGSAAVKDATALPGPRITTRDELRREILRQLARWRLVLQCARRADERTQAEASVAAYQEVHLALLSEPAPVEVV